MERFYEERWVGGAETPLENLRRASPQEKASNLGYAVRRLSRPRIRLQTTEGTFWALDFRKGFISTSDGVRSLDNCVAIFGSTSPPDEQFWPRLLFYQQWDLRAKEKKNTHTQRKEKKRGGNGNEEMITSNKKDQSQGRLVPASFSLAANLDAKLVPPGGHFLWGGAGASSAGHCPSASFLIFNLSKLIPASGPWLFVKHSSSAYHQLWTHEPMNSGGLHLRSLSNHLYPSQHVLTCVSAACLSSSSLGSERWALLHRILGPSTLPAPRVVARSKWVGLLGWSRGRVQLPMQRAWVRPLVREDSTCHGATELPSPKYWACTLQQEKPLPGEASAQQWSPQQITAQPPK